jgi:hypothetical protein
VKLDCLLDMYLAGAADTLKSLTAGLEGEIPPDKLKALYEEILTGLIKQKFGVTTNLVLLISNSGFRYAYRSGLPSPVREVATLNENSDPKTFRFQEEQYGVRVLRPEGGCSPEPYVWQER